MTPTETYLFLFTDSLVTGLVLPAKQPLVLPAMRIFGGYDLYLAGFIATIGLTIAACMDWVFGKMLRSLKKAPLKNNDEAKPAGTFEKILAKLKKYGHMGSNYKLYTGAWAYFPWCSRALCRQALKELFYWYL